MLTSTVDVSWLSGGGGGGGGGGGVCSVFQPRFTQIKCNVSRVSSA